MLLQKLTLASATLLAAGLIAWGASAALVSLREEPSQKIGRETESSSATKGRDRRSAARTEFARYTRQSHCSRPGARAGRAARPRCEAVPDAGIRLPTSRTRRPSMRRPDRTAASSSPVPASGIRGSISAVVAATAPNYGVGWVEVPPDGKRDDLTIRLADDDVPITGQIVDLEGKPVRGRDPTRDADQRGTRGRPRPLARSRQGQERAAHRARAAVSQRGSPSPCLCKSRQMPRAASGSPASAATASSRRNSTGRPSSASICTSSRGRERRSK